MAQRISTESIKPYRRKSLTRHIVCISLITKVVVFLCYNKFDSFFRYQQVLHRNLVYLASIADANQNIQALLPVSKTPRHYIGGTKYCIEILF